IRSASFGQYSRAGIAPESGAVEIDSARASSCWRRMVPADGFNQETSHAIHAAAIRGPELLGQNATGRTAEGLRRLHVLSRGAEKGRRLPGLRPAATDHHGDDRAR